NQTLQKITDLIPGILIALFVMFLGIYGAELIGYILINIGILSLGSKTPVSGIFVAIIIGIIIRNTFDLSDIFKKGISFSVKYALRAGIILLGLRLSLIEAVKLGAMGIPLILACIASGLFITLYLTNKMNKSICILSLITVY